jgi:S-DNA-T family DNA segregation ATPase FtsK/SpoIIIE
MERAFYRQAFLDRQADQIEATLSALAVPARVEGGVVKEDRVQYHLAPSLGTQKEDLLRIAERFADGIGVDDLRVDQSEENITVEVPFQRATGLRLLPLLHAMGALDPMSAAIGMTEDGHPLVLDFNLTETWHVLAAAPAGAGKSELLRTMLVSLALTTRKSQVRFLGIDLSGRELSLLDALPHALTDLATSPEYAAELLIWLSEEVDRRVMASFDRPHLVLFIDDLTDLLHTLGSESVQTIECILERSVEAGVHLVVTRPALRDHQIERLFRGRPVVRAIAPVARDAREQTAGLFRFETRRFDRVVEVAWLSLRDLDAAVRLARAGWRTHG